MSQESSNAPAGTGRIVLFGHAPALAVLEIEQRSDRERVRRAALRLGACWLAVPVVAFIPPHLPWILIGTLAGPYLARREWVGQYVVRGFEGRCPGCGGELTLPLGKAIRLPMQIDCPNCHRQSTLEQGSAGPA